MALLHPAPTSSIHAGHHRRNTSELLRRPALLVHSPRRLRLHAQKGPGTGTGTPSGSESDNVVLKAAWYASEALGVAVSFFRPSPSAEGDAAATDEEASEQSLSTLGRAQVAEAIKDDFARSYFVTGNLTLRAYEEECEFADPAGSFRGLQRFKRNCTNFGSLLEKSDMKLTKWEDLHVQFPSQFFNRIFASATTWFADPLLLLAGFRTNQLVTGVSAASCRSPGGPFSPLNFTTTSHALRVRLMYMFLVYCLMIVSRMFSATGYTEYYFDAESGKVCRHVENWNVPKMALLRQIFRPSKWAWEKR